MKELDKYRQWRRINKMKPGQTYRFTKQEIILRFFAFHDKYKYYEGHLAKFLNEYMHNNQNLSESKLDKKRQLFYRTVEFIDLKIFNRKAPPKLSLTFLEALLVGIGTNISEVEEHFNSEEAKSRYNSLANKDDFSESALREGLSKRQRVINRMKTAIQTFNPHL